MNERWIHEYEREFSGIASSRFYVFIPHHHVVETLEGYTGYLWPDSTLHLSLWDGDIQYKGTSIKGLFDSYTKAQEALHQWARNLPPHIWAEVVTSFLEK